VRTGQELGIPQVHALLSAHSYGEGLDLVERGDDVPMVSEQKGQFAYRIQPQGGTSNAAPEIAAIAALVWSAQPDASRDEVIRRILASSSDLGEAGYDRKFGHGLLNAERAVTSE
jgi:subtilisin family serine protease